MTRSNSTTTHRIGWAAALILAAALTPGIVRAQTAVPTRTLLVAANSRLPVPNGATVIADTRIASLTRLDLSGLPRDPNKPAPIVREIRLLIYRPAKPTNLKGIVNFFTQRQRLRAGQKPELQSQSTPKPSATPSVTASADASAVYHCQSPSGLLLLGSRRQGGEQVVFAVLMRGTLTAVQALTLGNAVLNQGLAQADAARRAPVAPAGFGRVKRDYVVRGQEALSVMQRSISADRGVSAGVKGMVQLVFAEATAAHVSKYLSPRPATAAQIRAFFQSQARARQWRFVTAHEDGPDKITLLYELPGSEGVLMIRAEPMKTGNRAVIGGVVTPQQTTLVFLRLEGKIDVNKLLAIQAKTKKR